MKLNKIFLKMIIILILLLFIGSNINHNEIICQVKADINHELLDYFNFYDESEPSNHDSSFFIKSDYDLLIISPNCYKDLLLPLVDHKQEMGIKTKLATLSNVYEESAGYGIDNAEKIKYFIRNAFDNWNIHFVMLVGDFKKMPVRYVYNNEAWPYYYEPRFISELYYADLYDSEGVFQDWNSNNNDFFGEWIGNSAQDIDIDLFPDVAVGRLACRNRMEVKTMVRKIIHYETETYGTDWFNRFVVVAGDTYPPGYYDFNTTAIEGEENTLRAIENMTGFEAVKLWVSTGAFNGPMDVIETINTGCGFMFFDGHASITKWGTYPAYAEPGEPFVWGLNNSDVKYLLNEYKLPIIVAPACHNAQFDTHPIKFLYWFLNNILDKPITDPVHYDEWALECWAWKLTSHPDGGSIATIANTGLGMSKEDKVSMEGAGDFMDIQFFVEYGNKRHEYLGDVWMQSISNYIDAFPVDWNQPEGSDAAIDAKTVQEWTLLGDPSLRIGGYPQI